MMFNEYKSRDGKIVVQTIDSNPVDVLGLWRIADMRCPALEVAKKARDPNHAGEAGKVECWRFSVDGKCESRSTGVLCEHWGPFAEWAARQPPGENMLALTSLLYWCSEERRQVVRIHYDVDRIFRGPFYHVLWSNDRERLQEELRQVRARRADMPR